MKITKVRSTTVVAALMEACNELTQHFPQAEDASLLLRLADTLGALQRMHMPQHVAQLRAERDLLAQRVVQLERGITPDK